MVTAVFSYLAGVIVITALLVVGFRNPIYSAVSLMVMFFHVAGLYLILNAEFLAAIQIIIYAGAILVLYLFVVMLLNLKREQVRYGWKAVAGVTVGLLIFAELSVIFFRSHFSGMTGDYTVERVLDAGQTQTMGLALFTQYLLPFEVASLILLAAMIGAIVLAKKGMLEEN